MDLRAFECPICFSLFEGSIFQCKNGHVVCNACCSRIRGTCPSCREHVGGIRCRALENIIADMAFPCAFSKHGCTQLVKHTERREREAFLYQHPPFVCPFQGCGYSAPVLYDHIHDVHANDYIVSFGRSTSWSLWLTQTDPFMVLLDPVDRSVFVLLNGGDVRSGRSLLVVCLGMRPANELVEYTLKVDGIKKPGALSLSASGSMRCMHSVAGQHPNDAFLFVPDTYWSSLYFVFVNVQVQRSSRSTVPRYVIGSLHA